jgi:hypothetical protein
MDSVVLDVKQARAGRCSRAVFSAPNRVSAVALQRELGWAVIKGMGVFA